LFIVIDIIEGIHDGPQAQFVAQGNLLAEAEQRESQLRTSIKETEHKVARLKDYEQQIKQHTAMQRLW
jgi:phage shock protein A